MSATTRDLNSPLLVLITKAKAPAARIKLIKNEPKNFNTKTAIDSNIIGVEQYMIRHRFCMIPLYNNLITIKHPVDWHLLWLWVGLTTFPKRLWWMLLTYLHLSRKQQEMPWGEWSLKVPRGPIALLFFSNLLVRRAW